MAAAGRFPTPWRCRTTGAVGITSLRCASRIRAASSCSRGRRTAESRGFFIVRPGRPHGRSHPPPASHQHLQCLQQLGRLQLVQLSRPRRLAGASRLLRPSNGRAVRPLGARLCRVGRGRWIRARLLRQFRSRMASRTVGQLPARAQRGARRVLVGSHARPPRSLHRRRGQRRVFQRQLRVLAGAQRGRGPGAGVLEATVQHGPGLRRRRLRRTSRPCGATTSWTGRKTS